MASAPGAKVQAEGGPAPALQATGYPAGGTPETDASPSPTSGAESGYPAGGSTPANTATPGPSPTRSATTPTLAQTRSATLANTNTPSPQVSLTPTETQTARPDVFRTEDSEMGGSLVTPPASETPGPTLTAVFTATGPAISSQTAEVVSARKTSGGGFGIDWGLFWIGFSVPVIVGCGLVLYLLDRKPSLFR